MVDLVNFNCDLLVQKFLSDSLVDFFMNFDPISVIFDSIDSPSSSCSKFMKTPKISPHFMVRFDRISKNILKLP